MGSCSPATARTRSASSSEFVDVTGRNPEQGGVYDNLVREQHGVDNGTAKAPPAVRRCGGSGSGIGIFGSGPGSGAYDNLVEDNYVAYNGLAGVTLHAHHPGGEDINGNQIIGNTFQKNNIGATRSTAGSATSPRPRSPSTPSRGPHGDSQQHHPPQHDRRLAHQHGHRNGTRFKLLPRHANAHPDRTTELAQSQNRRQHDQTVVRLGGSSPPSRPIAPFQPPALQARGQVQSPGPVFRNDPSGAESVAASFSPDGCVQVFDVRAEGVVSVTAASGSRRQQSASPSGIASSLS